MAEMPTPDADPTPAPEAPKTPEKGGSKGDKAKAIAKSTKEKVGKVQNGIDSGGKKMKDSGKGIDDFAKKNLRYGKDGEPAESYFGKDKLPIAIAKTVKDDVIDVLDGTVMTVPRRYMELASVAGGAISNAAGLAFTPIIHPLKALNPMNLPKLGKKLARTGTLAVRGIDASVGVVTRTLREVGNRAIRRPLERLEGPGLVGRTIGKILAKTGRAVGAVTGFAANQQDKVGDKIKEWDEKLSDNAVT